MVAITLVIFNAILIFSKPQKKSQNSAFPLGENAPTECSQRCQIQFIKSLSRQQTDMKWLLQDIVNKSTPEFNFDRVESSFEMLRKCQEHHLTTRAATPEETNYFSGLTSGVINFSANDHDLLHSSQLFWYRVGFEVC